MQDDWHQLPLIRRQLQVRVWGLRRDKYRDNVTQVKVRKVSKSTKKYDPYYIELSNTYSFLAELSANLSPPDTPTRTDSQFRIKAANCLQIKTNDKLKNTCPPRILMTRSLIRPSQKQGGACNSKYVRKLPFPYLSKKTVEANTLNKFPTSLMSVDKTTNGGIVSIFTK